MGGYTGGKTHMRLRIEEGTEGASCEDVDALLLADEDGSGYGLFHGVSLTEKQVRFVEELSLHGNGMLACKRAGYSGTPATLRVQAYQLKRNPSIKRVLLRVWFARRDRFNVTEGAVTSMLVEAYQMAMEEKQATAAVSAVKALAEIQGMLDRFSQKSRFGMQTDDQVALDAAAIFQRLGQEVSAGQLISVMRSTAREPLVIDAAEELADGT